LIEAACILSDLLRLAAIDGLGRTALSREYILEGGHHSEVKGLWNVGAGDVLGNTVSTGCFPLQLDQPSDGGSGRKGGENAE
jgi:hypothetical protein